MQSPPPARGSLPADLASLRARRGLTLLDIAEATKISVAYLRAIEEGRFDRLPGGIYDISYLRQYARAIGFDEEELIQHYRRQTGLAQVRRELKGPATQPRGWLRTRLALLRHLL